MFRNPRRLVALMAAAATLTVTAVAGATLKTAPPVGPLPNGPASRISTEKGQLLAIALPRRSAGRVWRIARSFDKKIVRQVSEADVGPSIVLVFRAIGKGTVTISFGLTRGETAKAYESRRFTVRVR